MKHIAVIPAREGSKGLPGKNRMFFNETAEFLKDLKWIDSVIVSTDDAAIEQMARERDHVVHKRPKELASDEASIRSVFESIVSDMKIEDDARLWLFYLPILYKNVQDFDKAKELVEVENCLNLCGFVKVDVDSHPYYTWKYDAEYKTLLQFVPNDIARRQDLPQSYKHHHYIFCVSPTALPMLNNEMIGAKTTPFFLSEETSRKLVEVDSPQQLKIWKESNA